MRESWTDERLDDLNDRVSDGFRRLDDEIKDVRQEVKDLGKEMNARFDSLHRAMIYGVIGFSSFVGTGFAAVFAAIITRL